MRNIYIRKFNICYPSILRQQVQNKTCLKQFSRLPNKIVPGNIRFEWKKVKNKSKSFLDKFLWGCSRVDCRAGWSWVNGAPPSSILWLLLYNQGLAKTKSVTPSYAIIYCTYWIWVNVLIITFWIASPLLITFKC